MALDAFFASSLALFQFSFMWLEEVEEDLIYMIVSHTSRIHPSFLRTEVCCDHALKSFKRGLFLNKRPIQKNNEEKTCIFFVFPEVN